MLTAERVRQVRAHYEQQAQYYAERAKRLGSMHAETRHLSIEYGVAIALVQAFDQVLQEDGADRPTARHRIRFPFEVSTL